MTNLKLNQLIRSFSLLTILALSSLQPAFGQKVSKARLDTMPRQYSGPRPLQDLVSDLTAKFGWNISLEEPPWIESQARGPMYRPENRYGSSIHNSKLKLPEGKLDLTSVFASEYTSAKELIEACLKAYSAQGNQGGYIVRESNGMLQIVPDPESPAVQLAGPSLLDWEIEVPVEKRYPREHFAALCDAIQQTSAIDCDANYAGLSFDKEYLANWPPERVEWGCSTMKARAALEELLSHSMTTMTWQQKCHPVEGGGRICYLTLLPLEVEIQTSKGKVIRRTLCYDRGWRFPYPQPPPPPLPEDK
ncbi:MAG: hypothetical protein ABFD89_27550 [Bryobacteraceae bacterium]